MKFAIGLKTRLPLSLHYEFLHFNLMVINLNPKNISDISQKRPIRLPTLNLLPFIVAIITLSAVSGSTGIGSFAMKPNTQSLTSWSRLYIL
jgi:hypothetical protein